MGGSIKGIGQVVGGVAGSMNPKVASVLGGMNLGGTLSAKLADLLHGGSQRARFIGILLATIEHINTKPHFNLELEINDLLVRLGNLRGHEDGEGLSGAATGGFGGMPFGGPTAGQMPPFGGPPGLGDVVGAVMAKSGPGGHLKLGPEIEKILGKMLGRH